MKRMLVFAAAALCFAGAAQAQLSDSKKYDWNSDTQSCMEPYAPAVPKAEETDLRELLEEVKPEVEVFIEESNGYLECLGVQLAKAREEGNKERAKELIKDHNDNVEYQKSVASEFNATLQVLKRQAGLLPSGEGEDGQKAGSDGEKGSGQEGAGESAQDARDE